MKILHAIPSPRDNIPEVLSYQKDLPFDTVLAKFMPEIEAYTKIRDYFLENKQYTHLALSSDDIVVKPEHLIQLERDLEETDFPVLSGIMNVNIEDSDTLNITLPTQLPNPIWSLRHFSWLTHSTLPVDIDGIIRVGFSGFPLMIIRRDVVEKIPFESDARANGVPEELGGSLDVIFCNECARQDIPIYADLTVNMQHLRSSGTFRVGIEKPEFVIKKRN